MKNIKHIMCTSLQFIKVVLSETSGLSYMRHVIYFAHTKNPALFVVLHFCSEKCAPFQNIYRPECPVGHNALWRPEGYMFKAGQVTSGRTGIDWVSKFPFLKPRFAISVQRVHVNTFRSGLNTRAQFQVVHATPSDIYNTISIDSEIRRKTSSRGEDNLIADNAYQFRITTAIYHFS